MATRDSENKNGHPYPRKLTLVLGVIWVVVFLFIWDIRPQKHQPAQAEVKASAGTDLCTAGGEAADFILTASETSFDGTDVEIVNCAFTIDGAHSFTSLTIGDSAGVFDSTLRHSETTTTTNFELDITTTGAFVINSDGQINVNGRGYPELYTAGVGGVPTTTNASTSKCGGSHGGYGGGGDSGSACIGSTFDTIFEPLYGGGGAGDWSGLPDGGGAVKIDAGSVTINGRILADGVDSNNGAAGGSVWIISAGNVDGSGTISAEGGDAAAGNIGSGGGGRIAIEYGGTLSLPTANISAASGLNTAAPIAARSGGAGTIYLEGPSHTNEQGDLILDDGGNTYPTFSTQIEGSVVFDDLIFRNNAYVDYQSTNDYTLSSLTVDSGATFFGNTLTVTNAVSVINGGILTHTDADASTMYKLDITADTLSVDGASFINLDGRGYIEETTAGVDGTPTATGASTGKCGGAHGGFGGASDSGSGCMGETFDSIFEPLYPGGGAGIWSGNPDGGGAIKVAANTITIDGTVTANGEDAGNGAAGGSVWLVAGNITGSGTISADGGDATLAGNVSSGGGGRIAVEYTGSFTIPIANMSAISGVNTATSIGDRNGGAGTIYVEGPTHTNEQGDLYIIDGGTKTDYPTPIPDALVFEDLLLDNDAVVSHDGTTPFSLSSLTIDGGSIGYFRTLNVSGDTVVSNSSSLRHLQTTTVQMYRLDVTSESFTLDSTSTIYLEGAGYIEAYTAGVAGAPTTTGASTGKCGGAHGGFGGASDTGSACMGKVYDSIFEPLYPGGGAGIWSGNPDGGGAVQISASEITIDGVINVDGEDAGNGAAGGSVWLISSGDILGAGSISAEGGDATAGNISSGGGGRIAIEYGGSMTLPLTNISAIGGTNSATAIGDRNGGAGTIYIEGPNDTNEQGDLIVDDTSPPTDYPTPLFYTGSPSSYTINDLSVLNNARLSIDQPPCVTGLVLTVTGEIDLTGGGLIIDNSGGNCTTTAAALSLSTTAPSAILGQDYSGTQLSSAGGYSPKTFICKDSLGGSVVACDNANAGLPNGLTLSSSGVFSGTPTVSGAFQFVVQVTDSDPGGAQSVEQTVSLAVSAPPSQPVLVSPPNASTVGTPTPILSSQYSDPDAGDIGTTEYRVSSGSSTDCVNNVSIVDSGSSAATSTNNEATTYTVATPLSHAATYNWCARNNDGALTSNSGTFTAQGSFLVDLGNPPNAPVLVSPENASTTALLSPILSATYSDPDPGDVGVTEYRISSGSAADCLSNISVVSSGSSATTPDNNETTTFTVGVALTNLTTYNWCARNNDGIFTSNSGNFTTMGSFLVDTSFSPGGGLGNILRDQQTPPPSDPGDEPAPTDEENLVDNLNISLLVTGIDRQSLPRPTPLDRLMLVSFIIDNPTDIAAENVTANLLLPDHILYVPRSLQVNNVLQTDGADDDAGQGSNSAVSAVWQSLAPGESKLVTFQLMFDRESLRQTVSSAANPVITLQATISAANAAETFASNSVEVEPDTSSLEPPDEEEPVEPEETTEPESETPSEPPSEPESEQPSDSQTPSDQPSSDSSQTTSDTQTPSDSQAPPSQPSQPSDGEPVVLEPSSDQSEQTDLILTGSASSQNEQISFSGTSSEPNATIQVLINGEFSYSVQSDSNGFWQLFVSAEELRIQSGQASQLTVEAYAQTDDGRQSNRLVQNIFVERADEGDITVEDIESTVSSNAVTRAIEQVSAQVQEIIQENEPEIQTTLAATAPVVIVASAPLWGYLPYLPTMSYHFITWLVSLFRKKKEGRLFGIVYDSISKQPLALAIVRVYRVENERMEEGENGHGKLVATEVTDKQGRYEFLLEPGNYRVEVKKPQYLFPSKIVDAAADGEYQHVYKAGQTLEVGEHDLALPDIPVDPMNAKRTFQLSNIAKKLWLGLQSAGHYLAVPLLFVGALVSVLTLLANPAPLNWILSILYVLMLVMQLTFRQKSEKAWGIVYEVSSNASVPLATIQLIDPEFGKVVKSRLSDYEGRFSFLPDPGKYVIRANKEGYTQTDVVEGGKNRNPLSGEISVQKEGERISGDVAMRQGG